MAAVFTYHVVGDLTVAKPEFVEFDETETVESAIKALGGSMENGIPVWKQKSPKANVNENSEMRQQRFVGILKPLHIVAFLAKEEDLEKAMKTPVSEIVVHNNSLLREVDPATRILDALEMMKQGVERLLVPKGIPWRGMSKKFSILYNGRWLKNMESSSGSSPGTPNTTGWPSFSSVSCFTHNQTKYCCLSREDIIRFLIGCLGALAPIPLTSICTLGAINPHYSSIEASAPAMEVADMDLQNLSAIAVVEPALEEGYHKIIGDISSWKLCKCDYLATASAMATLSAKQFVMGIEENYLVTSLGDDVELAKSAIDDVSDNAALIRPRKFSSRSMGFLKNSTCPVARVVYTGSNTPLTCKPTSSLAAVMAQMLSHRATHVWVTDDHNLVGVISYADILHAVTKPSPLLLF